MTNKNTRGTIHKLHCVVVALIQTVVVGGILFSRDLDLTWAWQLTPFLRFGPELNDKWILWAHDIYGPESGRTKEYCNKMWTDLGVTCILPDFFRGAVWPVPSPTWEGQLRWALVFLNPNTSNFKSAKVKLITYRFYRISIPPHYLTYWILSQTSSDWDLTFTWCAPDVHLTTWPSSDLPLTLTRPLPNLDLEILNFTRTSPGIPWRSPDIHLTTWPSSDLPPTLT